MEAKFTEGSEAASPSDPGALFLVLLCGVQLLMLLDFSIVNVALPRIEESVGFTHTGVQWVVSVYALTYGGFLMLGGRICDRLGRRRILLVGLALFGFASLAGGFATTPTVLVVARAVQGVGAALIGPAVLSLITTGTPAGAARNKALGWFSAASASGFAVGVLLGGILTQYATWRAVFFVNVPLVALAAVAAVRLLPGRRPDPSERERPDIAGAVLSILGVGGLIYGLNAIGTAVAPVVLAAGVLALVGFVLVERKVSHPLVPLGVFRVRSVSVSNAAALLVPGVMGSVALVLSLFLQQVQGRSALQTGMIFLTLGLSVIVAGPIAAGLVTSMGPRVVCASGGAAVSLGVLVLSRVHADTGFLTLLLPGLVLTGMGFSAFFASATIMATKDLPDSQQGLAGGLVNTSVQFGTAICVTILVALSANNSENSAISTVDQAAGYRTAFTVGAAIALVGALLVLFLLPRHMPEKPQVPDGDATGDLGHHKI